ncbi:MAG: phosphonate metabolism transcriptional regulator PhnF [Cyanobacteria bacterium P01_F01_bin.56]
MSQSALPLYVQIANELRNKIEQGIYQAGDKLPSQKEFGAHFGVNRHTIRQAYDLLKDEGLLRIDRGLGAFVADPPICFPIGKRVRYNELLQAQGYVSKYQVLKASDTVADAKVAQKLQMTEGDPLACVELVGWVSDRPLIVSTSYLPLQRFPDLLAHTAEIQSMAQLLQTHYGCDPVRQATVVSIRTVRSLDAKLLKIPLNRSILLVQAINSDQHGEMIEYTVTRFRGDGVELMVSH